MKSLPCTPFRPDERLFYPNLEMATQGYNLLKADPFKGARKNSNQQLFCIFLCRFFYVFRKASPATFSPRLLQLEADSALEEEDTPSIQEGFAIQGGPFYVPG